jgi:hypothetical protein
VSVGFAPPLRPRAGLTSFRPGAPSASHDLTPPAPRPRHRSARRRRGRRARLLDRRCHDAGHGAPESRGVAVVAVGGRELSTRAPRPPLSVAIDTSRPTIPAPQPAAADHRIASSRMLRRDGPTVNNSPPEARWRAAATGVVDKSGSAWRQPLRSVFHVWTSPGCRGRRRRWHRTLARRTGTRLTLRRMSLLVTACARDAMAWARAGRVCSAAAGRGNSSTSMG